MVLSEAHPTHSSVTDYNPEWIVLGVFCYRFVKDVAECFCMVLSIIQMLICYHESFLTSFIAKRSSGRAVKFDSKALAK